MHQYLKYRGREKAVRTHWEIESSLHWVLDTAFREDESRIYIGNAPKNFTLLRKIALSALNQEKSPRLSLKTNVLRLDGMIMGLFQVLAG